MNVVEVSALHVTAVFVNVPVLEAYEYVQPELTTESSEVDNPISVFKIIEVHDDAGTSNDISI